eukprot:TRINITY_DN11294_c0_g1_i1.p1 TRINITY_DN11294_c0_g1~~TRINITY_DN11294_c0_g1_i1.p1  ORF type:complete len:120 (+),score=4.57 TRINITY_DN11294_c0_g1_i1:228-587(+)
MPSLLPPRMEVSLAHGETRPTGQCFCTKRHPPFPTAVLTVAVMAFTVILQLSTRLCSTLQLYPFLRSTVFRPTLHSNLHSPASIPLLSLSHPGAVGVARLAPPSFSVLTPFLSSSLYEL